jgi:hypothetical protein
VYGKWHYNDLPELQVLELEYLNKEWLVQTIINSPHHAKGVVSPLFLREGWPSLRGRGELKEASFIVLSPQTFTSC